ncbi:amino acid ABC transporter permease [Frateuria aurantia]|uniref:Amine acid ABC transporter, permease protein, 3-TM region, His/Glu/Gln/Arg/opine family n=1 Tax=Frateuria aurantia (strain ATCC 33424 / DSM 6220 / KCTC 2777 / LMG 1558 / NBRC 3245 / NCIMB 13370) TaxID=767434 RepID=H8KYG7_FRAAD|nr:amino acid ABC transporter permease [Frateuria aurantia]AFC86971.1 amine acid ABC transporter, permease protein, 3-TM region, His/Glu/Gln/Arg/opine family [Frateuria aurantia DSM 6220]
MHELVPVILQGDYGRLIGHGIQWTLALTFSAWLLAMAMALLLITLRLREGRWGARLVAAYVSYHRNIPTLVQLMVWYFAIPAALPPRLQIWLGHYNTELLFACIALGLCQGAYFSEDIRSGIRAVAPGQVEAARTLGLTYLGALRHVILPQAIRHAMPALINNSVLLFKNTSLAMTIGLAELTYATREVESESFRTFQCFALATALYLLGALLLMLGGDWLSRRFRLVTER